MPRPASPQRLLAQRLGALFAAGVLLFDGPLLRLALGEGRWFGLPRGPLLLFAAWALLIGVLAWWLERGGGSDTDGGGESPHEPPSPP